ncbi:hypothetical protein FRC10_010647 [Ceratobasidium sp. 414]|nr:hypothetical protein FRC10_010647 [Ceratobasidium sp. 414]
MAPSSRMNLASLLQSDPPDEPRRPPPPQSLPPLPPPPAPYPDPAPYPSQSQPSHSQSVHAQPPPPNYTSAPLASGQNYSGSSSQYQHGYSQPPPQNQHLPPQPAAHAYHQPQSHSYTPSPTHTGPPPPASQAHHQYHQHSHQHPHHHGSHQLHPPQHSHLPHHSHTHHHPLHAHGHPHSHHAHAHHPIAGHAHSHVHVVHAHAPAAPTPPAPASSSSAAGSPPAFASHAFSQPAGARGPQPIIPLNSTPAPRSPVHYTAGSSRSPTAPYPIYGAGSLTGRRSPEFSPSGQPLMGAPSSSSGARRNTLTNSNVSSGPQAIEPVTLRDYPPYPNSGPTKHDEGPYPPAFSAPVYGSRPQSPQTQTGNKARRSGGTSASIASRGAGAKRSVGGSGELKRTSERGEKDEREMDKEREEHAHRERERERERDREQERSRERREYEEVRVVRERERERAQHEMELRDARRPPAAKRPLEGEFARRPASTSEWDRPRERERERDHRDRERRVPREQERDWRREEDEARQGVPTLVQSKHLPPLSAHGGYAEKQPHAHNLVPPLQQVRPHSHVHYTHPRAASPQLPHSTLPPLLAPIWLGTCVYPNIPFPVRLPPALPRNNLTPEGYKPYQYSILVPSGFLPVQPASRSPRPDVSLWGSPHTGYTDDSNVLLAAVHSGKTTWSDIRRARRSRQDVKVVVGVWAGGANGGRNATRPKGGAWEGMPGGGQLHSSSWGNTHDGGGMEIVEVVWMEPGSAHAPHRPNRRERMEQYAKRRADLELVPPAKRDRIETWYLDSDEEDAAIPAKRVWDMGEAIVFGKGGTSSGFVYEPHTLRSVVFEESNERSTKRFKSKDSSNDRLNCRRDIVLENDDEQYILALKSDEDGKTRKYTLSTLSPRSKTAEVLRKSLTEEDVSFLDKGLCVWLKDGVESKLADDKDKMDTGSDGAEDGADGDRKGWFCHVNRWKFAADDLKDDVEI